MLFSQLIREIGGELYLSNGDPTVERATSDSRRARDGTAFIAVEGTARDGHDFIDQAVKNGCSAVIVQKPERVPPGIPWALHPNTRRALALAQAVLNRPLLNKLMGRIVGITGTNGKTTTTYLLESIAREAGFNPLVIGTVEYRCGELREKAPLTTPGPELLWENIRRFSERGADYLIMEVSSHALSQYRVDGLQFQSAGFTNLSRDHLDYHRNMESYLQAKSRLFSELLSKEGRGVIPAEPALYNYLSERSRGPVWSFSDERGKGEIWPVNYTLTIEGIRAEIALPTGEKLDIRSHLLGKFNLRNILLAVGLALAQGFSNDSIAGGIAALTAVPGRMERVSSDGGPLVLVDYSHTPDALKNAIASIRELAPDKKLWTVFGCGGERDRGKRPIMGEIAASLSDYTVVTSDNPRNEDPLEIIREILEGIPPDLMEKVSVEPDREKAIQKAVRTAKSDHIVLIAGKGHETYQIIGGKIHHFDDREIAKKYLDQW